MDGDDRQPIMAAVPRYETHIQHAWASVLLTHAGTTRGTNQVDGAWLRVL